MLLGLCSCAFASGSAFNVSAFNEVWSDATAEPRKNAKGAPIIGGGMPLGNGDLAIAVFPLVNGSSSGGGGPCDAPLLGKNKDYCLRKNAIPCHAGCVGGSLSSSCGAGDSTTACATKAAPACDATPGCVGFAVFNHPASASSNPWVEWYNRSASSSPLPDNDWDYYYNTRLLPPPPAPPAPPFALPAGAVASFIVSKADAMASDTTLFKLGMVSLVLEPNPFLDDDAASGGGSSTTGGFAQTLDLATASVTVQNDRVWARVWVEAGANTVRAEVRAKKKEGQGETFTLTVLLQSLHPAGGDFEYAGGFGFGTPVSQPDVLPDPAPPQLGAGQDVLCIYHRNEDNDNIAAVNMTLKQQGLAALLPLAPQQDKWRRRTFGMAGSGPGLRRANASALVSAAPAASFAFTLTALSNQTADAGAWLSQLGAAHAAADPTAPPSAAARAAHVAWWEAFWARSYIGVTGPKAAAAAAAAAAASDDATDDAAKAGGGVDGDELFRLSKAHAHTRFVQAIQSRGTIFPIKFNGMLFTAQIPPGDETLRDWGANSWWQNARLPYWTMAASGDFDSLEVALEFYLSMVPFWSARTAAYFNHSGIFTTETKTLFGAYAPNDYGPDASTRTGKPGDLPVALQANNYLRYDYAGNAGPTEVALMALDHFLYTGDAAKLARYLPLAELTVEFFAQHYPGRTAAGQTVFFPTQAIETFWCAYPPNATNCCTNDLPTVAALTALLQKLLDLPEAVLPPPAAGAPSASARRAGWASFLARMPPLPTTTNAAGAEVLAPFEAGPPARHNSETPELYATHPFRLLTVGRREAAARRQPEPAAAKPVVDLGPAIRAWQADPLAHQNAGWPQGVMNAAMLGLAANASAMVLARARVAPAVGYRYPFFAPHEQDYGPSVDHFANMNAGLQLMLLQVADDGFGNGTMVLLPAWPCAWDVEFRLKGPLRTTVTGTVHGGVLEFAVDPPSRAAAVIALKCQ